MDQGGGILAFVEGADEGDARPRAAHVEVGLGERLLQRVGDHMGLRRIPEAELLDTQAPGVLGGKDHRGDPVETLLGGAEVSLAPVLSGLGPDRPPFVDDGHDGNLRRDLRVDPRVAGAVERGDVVEEDDVGLLLVQQQAGEAPRPAALGLHEDR